MILIGYSGHAFVVHGILKAAGVSVEGYCDNEAKKVNPISLPYFGQETSQQGMNAIAIHGYVICIGDNNIREKVYLQLSSKGLLPGNAIHPSACIDSSAIIAQHGVMIAAGSIINPLAHIGMGAICNTGSIIEHECEVGEFAHIGPGAILCGNVKVGHQSFIGAGAVVRQGIIIGKNAMVGAGAVVVKDVANGATVIGIPAR